MYSSRAIMNLALLLVVVLAIVVEARQTRYIDEQEGDFDARGSTGERAIITVRGARNPYDGRAPSKLIIEDNPYRGAYPRGVYDRIDAGYNRPNRPPVYPPQNNYNSDRLSGPPNDAPSRIVVTGAYPIGYGSRFD